MADDTAAIVAAILSKMGGSGNTQTDTTNKDIIKLNYASAKALLEQTVADIQYTGKLSKEDIQAFAEYFNQESSKQIEAVVRSARSQVTSGSDADLQKTIQSVISTSYPSFVDPKKYAKDFIWSKVNFKDETTLSGKSLTALQQVRQLANDMKLLSFSDAEVLNEAKNIAMGKKTITDLTSELTQKAIVEYPALAERFKTTPGITTRQIADPVIKLMTKYWEVPEDQIDLDNPLVQGWLRPGGADGKQPQMSYTDILNKIKSDPQTEGTTWKNEFARNAATSLARALGAGV